MSIYQKILGPQYNQLHPMLQKRYNPTKDANHYRRTKMALSAFSPWKSLETSIPRAWKADTVYDFKYLSNWHGWGRTRLLGKDFLLWRKEKVF